MIVDVGEIGVLSAALAVVIMVFSGVIAFARLRRARRDNAALLALIADSVDHLPDGIARFDADERMVFCNSTYKALNADFAELCVPGVSFETLARAKVTRDWQGGLDEDPEDYIRRRVEIFRGGAQEWEEHYADGSWVLARDRPTDDGGRICLRLDVTERKEIAQTQAETLAELSAVLEAIDYGIVFMDQDLRLILVNRAFRNMWNVPQDIAETLPTMAELMRYNRHNKLYTVDDRDFDTFVAREVARVHAGAFGPVEITRPDGMTLRYQCVVLESGQRMLTFYDITEQKRTEEKIRHMANHDPLTGLPSLRFAHEILAQSITLSRRQKWRFAVMFVDLDGFKAVNDSLGHEAGDILLCKVAERLSSAVRESDTVARIGGDEFLIVENAVHTPADAERIAKSVIAQLSAPFDIEGESVHIGASVGIALYPDNGGDPTALIKAADGAMYQVKRAQKNDFAFADEA